MENDLISRSALLNQRPEYLNPDHVDIEKALFAKGWNACNSEYYSLITDAAALETEPVRHGRWKIEWRTTVDYCTGEYDEEPTAICPFCDYREYGSSYGDDYWAKPFNYCPNCGTKMDAEVEG